MGQLSCLEVQLFGRVSGFFSPLLFYSMYLRRKKESKGSFVFLHGKKKLTIRIASTLDENTLSKWSHYIMKKNTFFLGVLGSKHQLCHALVGKLGEIT